MTRRIVHRFDEAVEVRLPFGDDAWRPAPATLLAHAVNDVDGEWWARVRFDHEAPEGEWPDWVPVWCVYRGALGDNDGVLESGVVVEFSRQPSRHNGLDP